MDCGAVALHAFFREFYNRETLAAHQVPTGILTGPPEDMEKELTSLVKCRSVPPSRPDDL